MEIFRWIAAGIMALLFLLLAYFNGAVFVHGFFLKKDTPSWVPLLGGAMGAGALAVCPVPGTEWWWWAPLLLDYGCVLGFAHTGWYYLREHLKKKKKRR